MLPRYAWYLPNAKDRTWPVGLKRPKDFGLFDMHGNVWQWCQDWYKKDYYTDSPEDDPKGPDSGTVRVLRGGCWGDAGAGCRAARRGWFEPGNCGADIGVRVACDAPRTP